MELNNLIVGGKPLNNLEYPKGHTQRAQDENPERTGTPAGEDPLQNIGKGKLDSLKESIVEINFLIEQRESLSKGISDEVDKIKMDIDNFLDNTTKELVNVSADSELFKERAGLRQKQVEVSEMQLNERVNCWRDVAMLKKELRERQRELSEKQDRITMLDEILEDGE